MHLRDINVWLAMAFRRHVGHVAAVAWFQAASGQCFFCRLTQMGFLRLASNPSAMEQVKRGQLTFAIYRSANVSCLLYYLDIGSMKTMTILI
jgi:predicted nucleic acid-binding protein